MDFVIRHAHVEGFSAPPRAYDDALGALLGAQMGRFDAFVTHLRYVPRGDAEAAFRRAWAETTNLWLLILAWAAPDPNALIEIHNAHVVMDSVHWIYHVAGGTVRACADHGAFAVAHPHEDRADAFRAHHACPALDRIRPCPLSLALHESTIVVT